MSEPQDSMLDRATYKQIKTMNREAMEQTFKNVYNAGYNTALEEAGAEINLDALRSDLNLIKGVGEARLNEIMAVIEMHLAKAK